MFIKKIFIFISVLSPLFVMAKAEKKIFYLDKVVTEEIKTEALFPVSDKADALCCDRQYKKGNAHDSLYNVESFLNGESSSYKKFNKSPSSGKR